ncbi:MAG: hypothetical protein K6B72_00070 [Lachnospiraceae bacterium]|nr:hypothetical protein [Lachnospiraceae bacterium]
MNDSAAAADNGSNRRKQQARELIFSCLCSFVLLLFCTRSSPLYPMNNWDDANSYFSMGKAMMNGMVPYRDLFDQKGILLYFLYGIGYLISHTTFLGVFIIEVIAAMFHFWAVLKIAFLLTEDEKMLSDTASDVRRQRFLCFLFVPLYGACVYSARCMWYGGSAEELMLPLFAWGMYLLLQILKKPSEESADSGKAVIRLVFIAGILAGCVLHIKFNSLGFFFGWMAAVFFLRLRRDGVWRSLIHCLVFLGGMAAATLPWLLYFLIRGAVYDWFHVTIYLNLFVYSEKLPLLQRLDSVARTLLTHFRDNRFAFVPSIAGIFWLFITRRANIAQKAAVFAAGLFLTIGIFIGGVTLPYYPVPLMVFALLAVPALANILKAAVDYLFEKHSSDHADGSERRVKSAAARGIAAAAVALLCYGVIVYSSLNTSWLGTKQSEVWQYRFRDDIAASSVSDPTLINMNCFDVGLYTVADIVPTCYFFQTQTIHLPDVHDRQLENLLNGDTVFVVACGGETEGIDERYRVIDEADEEYFGTEMHYYLYQREDTIQ